MAAPPIPIKGAGLLLRLFNPSTTSITLPILNVPGSVPTSSTTLTSTDDKTTSGSPTGCIAYEVLHLSKLIVEAGYLSDVAATKENASASDLAWQVYKLMTKRTRPGLEDQITPKGCPMVCVGITPGEGKYQDYADWFDEEHAELLSKVPGWRSSARYQLAKSFGTEGFVAPFIAVHFYDEVNGLGGEEWTASISTEWTKRIRNATERPHFRRIWTVIEQEKIEH